MNCCTGLIFPQFHFVVDNAFSTILSIRKGIDPPNWNLFFRASSELLPTSDFLVATDWKFSVPVDAPHCTDVLGFGVCDSVPSSYPTTILPTAHSPVTILDPHPLSVTFVILPSSGCVKPLTPAVCPTRILAPLPPPASSLRPPFSMPSISADLIDAHYPVQTLNLIPLAGQID